jgi:signal transduction histidine kinase/ActR/RegA family two-component response regulator
MTLRTKTTLIVSCCFIVLIALLLTAASIVMLGRFRKLEEDEARRNANRAGDALNVMVANLAATTDDWAHWDDMAAFVQGRMPQFVAANLLDDTYLTLRLDVVAFIGPEGRVVYQRWFDRASGETTEPLPGFAMAIAPGSPLVTYPDVESHREGILVLPGAILLVASQPVTGSLRVPPAIGTAVFGRILDKAEMRTLSGIVQHDTRLVALDDPSLEPEERVALAQSGAEPVAFVLVQGQDRITSLLRLKDITGEARVALIVNAPRPVFREGVSSILFLAGSLIACCLMTAGLLFVLLSRMVLSRLSHLAGDVQRISVTGATVRVTVQGRDELAQLAGSINGMLDALNHSEMERGKLTAYLMQTQKSEAVGVLAAGIAHDFNNILQIISSFTQILLHKSAENDPAIRLLRTIEKAIARGSQLTQQMLLFSKKVESRLEDVDMNAEIIDVCEMLERTIPKNIRVEHHLCKDLKGVRGDASQLQQILMNLALNARDAMPDGGRMVFESENVRIDEGFRLKHPQIHLGEHAMISISDTGMGMDSETMKRMYDAFFTTKEIGKGTGLGLAIVYAVVNSHHGGISCYSELRKGTIFHVYLPVYTSSDNRAEKPPNMVCGIRGGSESILVVDDEPDICQVTKEILERYGYRVTVAENGERALELYARARADLVILDLNMPGKGGHRCLELLRRLDPGAKVIIASGFSAQLIPAETIQLGISAIFNKPFLEEDLLRKIRVVLDGDVDKKNGRW